MIKLSHVLKWSKKSNVSNFCQSNEHRLNEVNIQMINKTFHKKLFDNKGTGVVDVNSIKTEFAKFKIDVSKANLGKVVDFELPHMLDKDIEGHLTKVAQCINSPYEDMLKGIDRSWAIPPMPSSWLFEAGWTKYDVVNNTTTHVLFPEENLLFFDVEIIVKESQRAVMAVALGKRFWYSWNSKSLIEGVVVNDEGLSSHDLISLHSPGDAARPKCIIGHFVSFDRARIAEEYDIEGTGSRFIDTMALHVAIAGMTSLQRNLKTSFDKRNIDNKLWRQYFSRNKNEDEEMTVESIQTSEKWINDATFNSLLDVYAAYYPDCDLPQNKDKRNTFVDGSTQDVLDDFQNLMKYCATDVLMTARIFKRMWPEYTFRFPHAASLTGMLEMGSLYLPLNTSWQIYKEQCNKKYIAAVKKEKNILMQLAQEALELKKENKFSQDPWLWDLDWSVGKNNSFPKWYRDLLSKNVDNIYENNSPELISSQMRIAIKLLRLKWDGLPVHYDSKMKWGVLLPCKYSSEFNDPKLMDIENHIALPVLPVEKRSPQKVEILKFPFRNYLQFWVDVFIKNLDKFLEFLLSKKVLSTKYIYFMDQMIEDIKMLPIDECDKRRLFNAINGIQSQNNKEFRNVVVDEDYRPNLYHFQLLNFDKMFHNVASDQNVNPDIPFCWFNPLPHEKGVGNFVGSPLSKSFLNHIQSGRLTSDSHNELLESILKEKKSCVFWRNYVKRIDSQMVVNTNEINSAIIPQVVVSGTVTRRAVEKLWLTATNPSVDRLGSELKAMVQPPKGWVLVGADVDAQEQWIAALLGDSMVGIHGGTPFGFLVLQGSKVDGTDLHSMISKEVGISRDAAKILNYSRMYGAGVKTSKDTLLKYNPELTSQEAHNKIVTLMKHTKGVKSDQGWIGGIESKVFSKLEEVASRKFPETPILKAQLSKILIKGAVNERFMTSRCNWVVQSSGVDYLHCLITFSQYLIMQYKIKARLCISIHDEIRYLCQEKDKYRMALILQIANLYTRAVFSSKLNLNDLPQSVAFFSEVDIDYCLRKNPQDDCVTPSNMKGLSANYDIPRGETLNIYQILEKTKGKLI